MPGGDPRTLTHCLTVAELCAWLGLEKEYVIRHRVRAGTVPHLRIGRAIRFAPEHVAEIVRLFEVPARRPARRRPARAQSTGHDGRGLAVVPGVSARSRAAHGG